MGLQFYDMVPQFSTVYFVFSQIWNKNFNMLRTLSIYNFNIKLSIYVKKVLTKFHENQGPVTYVTT